MPGHTPLTEIDRLCRDAPLLPATKLSIASDLPDTLPNEVHPETLVGKRREIIRQLGSGAIQTIAVEYYNDGDGIQLQEDTVPVLGSLAVHIVADRPLIFRGMRRDQQSTDLQLRFSNGGIANAHLGGTMPFDTMMEEETRTAWRAFGLGLEYEIDEVGGRFAVEIRTNCFRTMTAALMREN
jgi:hypothetical protein